MFNNRVICVVLASFPWIFISFYLFVFIILFGKSCVFRITIFWLTIFEMKNTKITIFKKHKKRITHFCQPKKLCFLINNVIHNTKRENEFRWSSFLNFRVLDCSFHSSWNRRFYSMNGSFICRDFSRKVQVKNDYFWSVFDQILMIISLEFIDELIS